MRVRASFMRKDSPSRSGRRQAPIEGGTPQTAEHVRRGLSSSLGGASEDRLEEKGERFGGQSTSANLIERPVPATCSSLAPRLHRLRN